MSLTMYAAGPARFVACLKNLRSFLDKAAAHAAERQWDPKALLEARLYPDMFPLTRQVQIACDMAKGACARLAGVEIPSHPDTEASFDELLARIDKVVDYIEGLPERVFDDAASRAVHLKLRDRELDFVGDTYLMAWAWPNFHFHMSTAYALLRHNGVPLGKRDYLGAV